jgi:hypothetical protein
MLTIDPDIVQRIIVKARQFDVKVAVNEPDPASNMAEDEMLEVIEDYPDDPVEEELREYISGPERRRQGDARGARLDRPRQLRQGGVGGRAARGRDQHGPDDTAAYLMGLPLLGDYLAEGMAEFGYSFVEE